MAEEEKPENEQQEPVPVVKKSILSMKLLIISLCALLVVGGGGFIAAKTFMNKKETGSSNESSNESSHGSSDEEPIANHKEKDAHGKEPAAGNFIFPLDTFIVNLNDKRGTRYLKIAIHLEIVSEEKKAVLETKNSQMKDALIILLSSKNTDDLMTMGGKFLLRDEILARVNKVAGSNIVKNAYFTDFVIQ